MFLNNEAQKMFEAIRENELKQAQNHFEDSLRKSLLEQDVEGLAEFASSLSQAGFLDEARSAYLLLKEMAPSFEEWDLLLAEIAIDQNRVEEGLDILLQFDKSSELYPHALLTLADAYQMLGLYEVSEHKIREAMQLLPGEPLLLYALGKLYHSSGKYQQAITLYEQLLQDGQEEVVTDNLDILLADCKNATGDFEAAVHHLERVQDEEHTSDSLFQLGISYFQLREYKRSAQVLKDLLLKDPDYNSAYFYLSKALEEEHQLEEALEVIQEGIDLDPYQAEFYLSAATLQLRLKQTSSAEKSVAQALQLDPEVVEANVLRVDLYMQQERYDDVISLLSNGKDALTANPQISWRLAQAYNEVEDFESAAATYEKAYLPLNDDMAFLMDYSEFLVAEGNLSKLAEVVGNALLINPEDPYFLEIKEERLTDR